MATMTIYVKEATEESPIQSLEGTLTNMPEVERALVDVDDGEVKITYDEEQISDEQIAQRIQLQGYHLA